MIELRVPEEIQIGIEKLISLETNQLDELFSVFSEAKPTLLASQLTDVVVSNIKTISKGDVGEIVTGIVGLYAGITSLEMPPIEFIHSVLSSMELELPEEQFRTLKDYLERVLQLESITVTSKALDVLLEHEHTLHNSRMMTDVRPIFVGDPQEGMSASVIIHTLKLRYHEGRELKQIYVALDSSDIKSLQEVLRRAQQKEERLKADLKKANIRYLPTE